jgi:hypothetical protein
MGGQRPGPVAVDHQISRGRRILSKFAVLKKWAFRSVAMTEHQPLGQAPSQCGGQTTD